MATEQELIDALAADQGGLITPGFDEDYQEAPGMGGGPGLPPLSREMVQRILDGDKLQSEDPSAGPLPVEDFSNQQSMNPPMQAPVEQAAPSPDTLTGGSVPGTGDLLRAPAPRPSGSAGPSSGSPAPAEDFMDPFGGGPVPGGPSDGSDPIADPISRTKELADEWLAKSKAQYEDIKNTGKFESNRWFQKLNLGSKIATGMSLAALAVSDALAERRGAPPRDSVGKVVDRLINQDVAEQKEQYERKIGDYKNSLNLYGVYRQQGLDEKEADARAKLDMRGEAADKLADQRMGLDVKKEMNDKAYREAALVQNAREGALNRQAARESRDTSARFALDAEERKTNAAMARTKENRAIRVTESADKDMNKILMAQNTIDTVDKEYNKWQAGGDKKLFTNAVSGIIVPIAKGMMGESGALSDGDMKRLKSLMPLSFSLEDPNTWTKENVIGSDNPKQAKAKINMLKDLAYKAKLGRVAVTSSPEARAMMSKQYNLPMEDIEKYRVEILGGGAPAGGGSSAGLTGFKAGK